ncbi:hypothetical protein QOZ80_5BG0437170 [Eleusine coracana subsp. coracana]|nr:hypothetical protein QOZ80_5BG0437170 [Eleusine coracana subsp. coracana]
MTEAIVSAVVGEAVSRVVSLVTGNFSPQQRTEAKLQRICRLLIRIHSVVEEAKGRQIENQGVLQWLSQLIDGEYEGRYLIDTIGCTSAVGADGEIVDRVLENLQGLSGDLVEFIMLLQGYRPIRQPLATNIFMEGQMFGRHVEKERIINFLLHDGGATVVLWSKHVIGDPGVNIKEPLQLIKRDFGNKRFLMVFEDVDMRKKQMLEELLPSLRCGKKGSKIVFTTNNRRVASIGTVELIILKVLPQPQYWFFFKAHAFRGRDVEENPRLVAAGKAIVRKLNGSFFGAKIVRGLLKDHPDPKFWCKVLRSNIGGLSLLGDGLAYIADLVENLLPKNVDMCHVTISKDQYSQTELARFQDLCDS